jgi:hypothetical protein
MDGMSCDGKKFKGTSLTSSQKVKVGTSSTLKEVQVLTTSEIESLRLDKQQTINQVRSLILTRSKAA